jgi:uncharacterized protein (DUF2235 family)
MRRHARKGSHMATRIIVLSDGTGNTPNKVWRSNVWRIFQYIDRAHADQVAMYDDGVGTSSFLPLALFGGMFGWGLKRNVLNLYKFICRNYKTGKDEIFAFGFSRGAFTIDVLISLIASQGLVVFDSEAQLTWKAEEAYRAYRLERSPSITHLEEVLYKIVRGINFLRSRVSRSYTYDRSENMRVTNIRFVGLWDTVSAYGLPLEGMTRALSRWFWPLDLPNRELSPIVQRACHALALDDERITFHPILWNERGQKHAVADAEGKRYIANERISQVWFSGSHANVGGGYPDDSLSYISLCWMLKEAAACGLLFNSGPEADPDAFVHAQTSRDRDGRIYDSRRGIHRFYRYGPRNLSDLCDMRVSRLSKEEEVRIVVPKIHESVFQRIRRGARAYAPLGIPSFYEVVTEGGQILKFGEHQYETLEHARARYRAQMRVWNLVWRRKVIAYVLGLTWLLVIFLPFFVSNADEPTDLWRHVSTVVRIADAFIPYSILEYWIEFYASHPVAFATTVFVLVVFHYFGRRVKTAIVDEMKAIWTQARLPQSKLNWRDALLYRFRTHPLALTTVSLAREASAAFFAVVVLLYGGLLSLGIIHGVVFKIQDAGGMVCQEGEVTTERELSHHRKLFEDKGPMRLEIDETKLVGRRRHKGGHDELESENFPDFKTQAVCHSTGVWLDRGQAYSVTLENTDTFYDDGVKASSGFHSLAPDSLVDNAIYVLQSPLKRHLFYPWFTVIARIGSTGATYIPLDADPSGKYALATRFKAAREGELFLYVNDAVIGVPGQYGRFYTKNYGGSKVRITRLPSL